MRRSRLRPTDALQKRSFAFHPPAPQALADHPGERSGTGFLPDSSLGWTRTTQHRVLEQFAADCRIRPQQLLASGEVPFVVATGTGALSSHILGVKDQAIILTFKVVILTSNMVNLISKVFR